MKTQETTKFDDLVNGSETDSISIMLSFIACYKEALERYNKSLNIFDLNDLISSINMVLLMSPKYKANCHKRKYPVYLTVQRYYKLALRQKETIEGIQKARQLRL